MNRINSLDEIQAFIGSIKKEGEGFLTNFYLDAEKHALWINSGELYYIQYDKCIFLLRKCEDFNSLFYITTNRNQLEAGLERAISTFHEMMVVDIVNRGESDILELFKSFGFQLYETLYRMNRIGNPAFKETIDEHISMAGKEDALQVKRLLDSHFNPISEQIPSLKEISIFIEEKHLLVYKKESLVVGFILYELNGLTLYLRYWFVSPEYRDAHIGAKLFNAFMKAGAATKRQLFWVIANNGNAIKRYQHYGFKAENMYDYVLVKNKI